MSYSCEILLDSISETGKRLTTFEITFPRIVLAEFNTHRMFSRNSASSRAIPFKKQLERIVENPFIPERFPIDGKGMQPNSYIDKDHKNYNSCQMHWMAARDSALDAACNLYSHLAENINNDIVYYDWDWQNDEKPNPAIHKQIINRLLEPFMWHTVIVTATEFDNFFKLRCDENAQYEIRRIADLMYEAYHAFDEDQTNADDWIHFPSISAANNEWSAIRPQKLKLGEWHCPLVSKEDMPFIYNYANNVTDNNYIFREDESFILEIKKKISVARCARVSYLTHDGKRDIEKDLELFERLRTSGHWSPFEHVATPSFISVGKDMDSISLVSDYEGHNLSSDNKYVNYKHGNFIGWKQYRKEFQDENCTNFRKESQ